MNNQPIILFDGVCNYCNWMVRFAIKQDKNKVLKFASLQSEIGKEIKLKFQIPNDVDSLVFVDGNKAFTYATAAIGITKYFSYPANFLYLFRFIPTFISNPIYKFIAKNRYKWFGKTDECQIPSPEIKNRFL
jgi:predicted DCC family thiol-disulfide oxidoreductase YuxK